MAIKTVIWAIIGETSVDGLIQMWRAMGAKKKMAAAVGPNEFDRILNVVDLTVLGVGSMLGMGVYIMAGSLSKTVGPAMCLSFLMAGFAATLAGKYPPFL